MCGIAGVYNFSREPVKPAMLRQMTDLLAHRGPDDAGHWTDGHIGLGHRRLAVIDLTSAGHQPMRSESGATWISYNGECYNHLELRPMLEAHGHRFRSTSDTETILCLYEQFGIDFLSRLSGMFAIAIWDRRQERLLLARDRLGIKPLYYFQDDRHLAFASELKGLLADPALPSGINPRGLSDYLHLMSISDPETILAGVRKVRPGHYLAIENDIVREVAYWEIPIDVRIEEDNFESASRSFDRIFHDTVSEHLLADVPVGAFLSGGVDSSSVVAAMRRHSSAPILTFSSTFRGEPDFDESSQAAAIAGQFGTDHREIELTPRLTAALPRIAWHADEPFAISSAFALYFLAEEASRHARVVLTGDGGDEVFAGYPWRHHDYSAPPRQTPAVLLRMAQAISRRVLPDRTPTTTSYSSRLRAWLNPGERYARSLCVYQPDELDSLLTPEFRQNVRTAWNKNVIEKYYDRYPKADQLTRKLYTDLKSTLVSEMLTKVDRMTMAFGLEARVPFLDHRLVEWSFGLPSNFKLRGNIGKAVVRRGMEPYLSRDLLYAPKHGFNVPMKSWLEGELNSFVRDNLSEPVLKKRGIFNPAAVAQKIAAHAQGNQAASNQILTMLMLELWFQNYVDRRSSHLT